MRAKCATPREGQLGRRVHPRRLDLVWLIATLAEINSDSPAFSARPTTGTRPHTRPDCGHQRSAWRWPRREIADHRWQLREFVERYVTHREHRNAVRPVDRVVTQRVRPKQIDDEITATHHDHDVIG